MRLSDNDRQWFAVEQGRFHGFSDFAIGDSSAWNIHEGIVQAAQYRPVVPRPIKTTAFWSYGGDASKGDETGVSLHARQRQMRQAFFQQTDQRRLPHTRRSNHQDHGSWTPFARFSINRTNRLDNRVERVYQP